MKNLPPSVTIVVVPRERFNFTRQSLDSIYSNTDYPFQLVYVDGNSPSEIKEFIKQESVKKGFKLIRTDHYLSPNQARNLGQQQVDSKYVVFVDNDLTVKKGWLGNLVNCAEETGAWAVGPLYFEGNETDKIIHMAGGDAHFTEENGVRDFRATHDFSRCPYEEVKDQLTRKQTESVEFHCVLAKNDVFEKIGKLDEELLSMNEHLDFALLIRQAGGEVYLEPSAIVTYSLGLLSESDMEFALFRWSPEWNQKSIDRFINKWNLSPGSNFASNHFDWAERHIQKLKKSQQTLSQRMYRSVIRLAKKLFGPSRYLAIRNSFLSKIK